MYARKLKIILTQRAYTVKARCVRIIFNFLAYTQRLNNVNATAVNDVDVTACVRLCFKEPINF